MTNFRKLIVLLCSWVTYTHGLKCMTCHGWSSFDECDSSGQIMECMKNQRSCETVVRRFGDHMSVMKGCKEQRACQDNQYQNKRHSGRSTQCNSDQTNSVCTCCCGTDFCNVGIPTCTTHYTLSGSAKDCPQVPTILPHGNVECSTESKVCEYQCTGQDYAVWPKRREVNVCLGNGSWANEPPCCARPCPPYYLLDDVFLYHVGGENQEAKLKSIIQKLAYPKIAEDALMAAALYYSTVPVESSVIRFNEYGANVSRLLELAMERIRVVKGPANTGAAIQYALDNLLTPEAGMRDNRVPKAIWVQISNANPADDVKEPSEEARRRGYKLYVIGYQTDGFKFDRQKLLELTGDKEHLFLFDKDTDNLTPENIALVNSHFCGNPCDHVLHDHH